MAENDFMKHFMDVVNASEYKMDEFLTMNNTPLPEVTPQDLSGKVVIVTGANVGIGFETAKAIASMKPKKLILACRNAEKAQNALKTIETATNFHDIEVWLLDLSSFESTQAFAKKFNDSGLPLDILVSNAGLGVGPWVETPDGYEITSQVNHLSNALLVSLLHPALKRAKSSPETKFPRVVLVASDTHFWASYPTPEDEHPVQKLLTKQEAPLGVYPSTKLMNVLFAKAYAAKCPDQIFVYSCNPGYTESELGQKDAQTGEAKPGHAPPMKKRTTYEGAKTIIDVSISPNVGASGGYYSDMKESRTRSSTQGETGKKFADNVWKDTIAILKKHVPETAIYSW
jgi:retinol dehydrogenase-12